ncbi:23S rRNA pseudouridine(1911/1915/1917) synthase RluD [Thiohalophilus thiocyanatoxydans]|uniref:Pseudouridine synthase n=1 Tax=Thiohalophilus thiocyanatoxydans TaxID=381308 RepID=A0A4R8IV48_9GAMM|nr:23S rRNA pseudouridine(1911/1915/1917) synthase RluD [Thiohalophilus thiocyanatoxydans]TDY01183.1 ribosomal large subunit pseudouridine synthase D [Thiohalophilus thiocyanatoxydans]
MTTQRTEYLSGEVPDTLAGQRLDLALAQLFSQYSRSRLQQWLKQGCVRVDGRQRRGRDKVLGGEQIEIEAVLEAQGEWQAEPIELDIVYEDEALIVLNKPAGLVVHPAAGNPEGTMLNALLHHDPELAAVPRAGIVHRLDKETTGLLVVARTLESQKQLVEQLQARRFLREYQAVVNGVLTGGGKVDAPVARHPTQRKRMAVVQNGKPAITHYRIAQRFRAHTGLRVTLETGRTHQIRVHMAHIHHPLVGDPTYGGRLRLPKGASETLAETLRGFKRQALHASKLGLQHPLSGETLSWEQPLPADMMQLIEVLERDGAEARE